MGTAAIAAGLQFAKMADETNRALSVITTRVPGATGKIDELRQAATKLAIEYGISQDRVVAAMDATSRAGVKNSEELLDITKTAIAAGVALGRNGEELIEGLDAALGLFGVSAKDASAAMAVLFSVAEGRTSLDDMFTTFRLLAPVVQGTGLDFLTTASALGELLDREFKPGKQVVAAFAEELRVRGVPGIQALAKEAPIAGDAMEKFTKAVEDGANRIENKSERIRAEFRGVALEIGDKLIPVVTGALEFLSGALDLVRRGIKGGIQGIAIEFGGKLAGLFRDTGKETEVLAGSIANLGKAGGIAAGAAGNLTATWLAAKAAVGDFGSKSVVELTSYKKALELATKAGTQDEEGKKALIAVNKELEKRHKEGAKAAEDAAEAAKKLRAEFAERFVKDLDKWAAGMARVRKISIETSVTLTDDLEEAIRQLRKELTEAGVSAEHVEEAIKPLNDQLKLVKLNERLDLPNILKKSAEALTSFDLSRLEDARLALTRLRAETLAGSTSRKAIDDEILAINEKIVERNRLQVVAIGEAGKKQLELREKTEKTNETFEETVRKVTDIASGALGVAQAFGLVDTNTARVLQNIISIGAALPKAFTGDPSAIIGVIGNLAGVIGGLFGDSPTTRAREALLRANNERLAELRARIGDLLQLNVPGGQFAAVQRALQAILAPGGIAPRPDAILAASFQDVVKALTAEGLTLTQFRQALEDLGLLEFVRGGAAPGQQLFFTSDLQRVLAGLAEFEPTKFGQTFAEQMERIRSALTIGVLEPGQEFAAILEVLQRAKVGAPAITEALQGIDVFSKEGREAAIKALQNLFEQLPLGTIPTGGLGGLTGQQFLDTIERLIGLLRGEGPLTPLGPIGGPGTPVPEFPPIDFGAAFDEQASLATESLGIEAQQLEAMRSIEKILTGIATFQPIAPPPLPATLLGATATGPGVNQVTVNIQDGAIRFELDGRGDLIEQLERAGVQQWLAVQLYEAIIRVQGQLTLRT